MTKVEMREQKKKVHGAIVELCYQHYFSEEEILELLQYAETVAKNEIYHFKNEI